MVVCLYRRCDVEICTHLCVSGLRLCAIEGRESDCLFAISERRRWFTAEHVKLGDDHGGDVEHAGILNQVICTDWAVSNQPGYNLGFQSFLACPGRNWVLG